MDNIKNSLTEMLKDYKKKKDAERKNSSCFQGETIELLKKKNKIDVSFEEAEQAYKDAGLYNNEDLHKQ